MALNMAETKGQTGLFKFFTTIDQEVWNIEVLGTTMTSCT
jgi:hypothetical protein